MNPFRSKEFKNIGQKLALQDECLKGICGVAKAQGGRTGSGAPEEGMCSCLI